MDEKEKKLREDLEFHLDTLRRNLEVVSMEDPRKAAVAAALARVKAKKAAQQADTPAEAEPAPAAVEEDPRKAAVAAAIARAKAKKAARESLAAETEDK